MNWERITLGDICHPKQWKTISTNNLKDNGYPVYGANGKIGFTDHYTHEKPTILVTCRGATCGSVNVTEPYSYANGNAMALDSLDNKNVDLTFLKYCLINRGFKDVISGSAQPQITRQNIVRVDVPLPPLDEQRRIAKILDNIQNLESINNRSIQLSNELSNSLFNEMFGEPLINPRGWIKLELEKLTFKITDGEHINPIFQSEGMPIVMAGNVLENSIDFKNTKFVEEQTGKKFQKKCLPQKDDVLLVSRGATIGRLCLVETTQDFCLMGSVILIKIKPEIINPIFLSQLLKQSTMRRLLFKTSGSSAQQAIYLKDLKKLLCIIPPIKTQNLFAKRLHSIKELITRQSTRSIKVNKAFESVSSELMSIKNKK